jgi:hypothetical protein
MRLLILGLSLCVALAGCSKSEEGTEIQFGAYSLFDPIAANPSLCGSPAIPFPNNALFSGTTDATLNIPNPAGAPFVTAANLTDGYSTSASMFTDVLGQVDFSSAANGVRIFAVTNPNPALWAELQYGVDFTVQPSIATAQFSGTGHAAGTCPGVAPALFRPISQQRSRLLIEPLKPLNPSTSYIVVVTDDLLSTDGVPATAGDYFRAAIQPNTAALCDLNNTNADATVLDCSDPLAPDSAAARLNMPFLGTVVMSAAPTTAVAKLTTLETLRSSLIRPMVNGLQVADPTLTDARLVIAWSFTTQSTALTMNRLNTSAAAAAFQVANTTISTGDLGLGLADTADIWAGIIQVPYYLANTGGGATAPLTTSWTSAANLNAVNPPALGGAVPCGALAKSASTSICYPDPAANSTESIPVIVTVPNGNSGQVKPGAGWPVVVFQHGITRNRTDVLAIAPTLAAAGFVVVSIDQPLHGITNNSANLATNPFYENQIFTNPAFGGVFNGLLTGERTFDLDLVDNTPDPNPCLAANNLPDTVIDSSGTHFVNLSNLAVARDNLRQSEADLLHLVRSIVSLDLDQNSGALTATDIDETRVDFAGQSLGSIVGTVMLGTVNNTVVQEASLHVPGGGLGKLLDASAAFGPRISGGLGCSGIFEGTDTYETYVRFAQHLMDPADPINYAAAANANHPLHVVQVISDAVVPNSAASTCPAADALPPVQGLATAFANATDTAAGAAASSAALLALCPVLTVPADPPLAQFTYQDEVTIGGFLSGTDALVATMGITNSVAMGNAPFAAQPNETGDTLVVFAPDTAEHGTLLTPRTSSYDPDGNGTVDPDNTTFGVFAPATCAMQKQTATFLASNGALLPIGGTCP